VPLAAIINRVKRRCCDHDHILLQFGAATRQRKALQAREATGFPKRELETRVRVRARQERNHSDGIDGQEIPCVLKYKEESRADAMKACVSRQF
jgi:hypothetical protein